MSLRVRKVSNGTFYHTLIVFMNLLSLKKLDELFLLFIEMLNLFKQ